MGDIDKSLADIQNLRSEKMAGKRKRKKQLDLFVEDEHNVLRDLLEIKEDGRIIGGEHEHSK